MKVYIASRYNQKELNQKIYCELQKAGIDAFLPASINIDAVPEKPVEQRRVGDICYSEVCKCDVTLGVWSFGRGVSGELGYAIRDKGANVKIVILDTKDEDINSLKSDVMIWPYIDKTVDSISELIDYLQSLKKSMDTVNH